MPVPYTSRWTDNMSLLLNYTMTSAQKSLTMSKQAPGDINSMSGWGGGEWMTLVKILRANEESWCVSLLQRGSVICIFI